MLCFLTDPVPLFLDTPKMVHTTKNQRIDGENPGRDAAMRHRVPKPGTDYQKVMLVTVGPGEDIGEHAEKEHVVMYYVKTRGVPVIIDGSPRHPADGETVYIPPGVIHSVPTNHTKMDRISIAMVVDL